VHRQPAVPTRSALLATPSRCQAGHSSGASPHRLVADQRSIRDKD